MARSRSHRGWVQDGNQILPLSFYALTDLNPPKGACTRCGGAGQYPESIDDERFDTMVPCFMCRVVCKPCGKYVKKSGHECAARSCEGIGL